MTNKTAGFLFAGVALLTGCAKAPAPETTATSSVTVTPTAPAPSATVRLKNGTSFSGSVMKTDTSAITLQAANGESRTYPMTEVDSVKYGDPAPPMADMTQPSRQSGSAYPDNVSNKAPLPSPRQTAPALRAQEVLQVIPAGTTVSVRNSDTISSSESSVGQTYPGVVTQDVIGSDGSVAIPRGSDAMLVVRSAQAQGRVEGQSELAVDLDSVTVGGRHYRMETVDIVEKGAAGLGKNKRSAEYVGGGGAFGAIIGAVAGGGKGAAIGALSGAAAGGTLQAVTRGKSVRIPAETILTFRLEAAVRIRPAR